MFACKSAENWLHMIFDKSKKGFDAEHYIKMYHDIANLPYDFEDGVQD